LNATMKPGAAETAPLLQKLDETNQPKPGAIAAAVRQAKRGVGVFGVALALSGVLVAIMAGPDAKKNAFELQMDATTPATTSADEALCVPNKWAPGSFTDPTKDQKNRITLTDACKAQFTCPAGNYLCGNQPVHQSFLGDGMAALVPSSGEESASPRLRAGVASMARRTRRKILIFTQAITARRAPSRRPASPTPTPSSRRRIIRAFAAATKRARSLPRPPSRRLRGVPRDPLTYSYYTYPPASAASAARSFAWSRSGQ
jgi:hypothetical protein